MYWMNTTSFFFVKRRANLKRCAFSILKFSHMSHVAFPNCFMLKTVLHNDILRIRNLFSVSLGLSPTLRFEFWFCIFCLWWIQALLQHPFILFWPLHCRLSYLGEIHEQWTYISFSTSSLLGVRNMMLEWIRANESDCIHSMQNELVRQQSSTLLLLIPLYSSGCSEDTKRDILHQVFTRCTRRTLLNHTIFSNFSMMARIFAPNFQFVWKHIHFKQDYYVEHQTRRVK